MSGAYRSDLVDIGCMIVGETDKAIRVDDGATRCWLPKSQIEFERSDLPNKLDTVTLPEWLAKDKGLI